MAQKATIIVPGDSSESEQIAFKLAETMTDLYGGASYYEGTGMWKDESGTVIHESHIRVTATDVGDCEPITEDHIESLANWVERENGDDCVYYEIQDVTCGLT